MDNAMEFMKNLAGNITGGINNCMMGKIEKFDGETMKADIVPLARVRNKAGELEEVSMLIEVPVSFIKAGPFVIRPPYKPGDIVLVVFADADVENILLSGSISNPNSTRKHSLDDAIVVGGIMPFTTTLPGEHLDDLIIAKDDFTSKIVIKEDGTIEILAESINIKARQDINIEATNINVIASNNITKTAGNKISDNASEIHHN